MANFERLEPRSGEMPVFEDQDDTADGSDDGSRLPLLVVIALLVLAAFAGVVWLAYNQGLERGRADSPRAIEADTGPAPSSVAKAVQQQAVPPEAQAAGNSAASPSIVQPPAPTPAVKSAAASTPKPIPAPIAAPPKAAPVPPVPSTAVASASGPSPKVKPTPRGMAGSEFASAAPPSLSAAPATEGGPPTPLPKASPSQGSLMSARATHAPAMLTQQVQTAPVAAVAETAATPPAATPPAATAEAPTAPAPAVHAPTGSEPGNGYLLQIGSYKSQEDANAAWQAFKSAHPAAAAYQSDVKSADLGEKGTWYRLRIGAFPDREAAGALCAKLKSEGATCFLAR